MSKIFGKVTQLLLGVVLLLSTTLPINTTAKISVKGIPGASHTLTLEAFYAGY